MPLKKPKSVAANEYKSAKWDEIVAGRKFDKSDIPTLKLLVQWHAVIDKCEQDMEVDGDIQVAYQNTLGDVKALPQIAVMKQASAEIRAINKQLGIKDDVEQKKPKISTLAVIRGSRNAKKEKARSAAS